MAEETIFVEGSPCVVLDAVGKRFTVRSSEQSGWVSRNPLKRMARRIVGRQARAVTVQALNLTSLVVERGESIGIIGRNGSGKSTMMKLICGQQKPSAGAVYASSTPIMLGVNAALVPELSGDQNIVLGCLAMGLERAAIEAKFSEIVELSGLEKSIHLPMKGYSSGMSSRLRFAIAAAVEPEILLVDEALNTGDAQFLDRSRMKMDELRANAGCVFIVSHSLETIVDMSTRVLWLDYGDLVMDGDPQEVTAAYRQFTAHLSKGNNVSAQKIKDRAREQLVTAQLMPRVTGRRKEGFTS
ncbi:MULTISPECIES: ABC transporter ATP-binding protein [Arthrobacter]|uniref:ABC transporter ATP-binding protein n=2 Tax=Arthrobacter TaxID=1663 RepID=A0ABU9KQZ5_9MICC|nr:ABC transporter ATP-binding protein [Arthrobacter sp. YJM1]MDP5228554.1 ABC transporter ATP-binding protein [Arthrobacter sp. YJM1]